MQLIIPVQVDYGAQEFLWYSSFNNIEGVILWWENKEYIDIYKYINELEAAKAILSNGKIISIKTEEESNLFYKLCADSVSPMIDNDYSSYLSYRGKRYFHKGKLDYFRPSPPI